MTDWVRLWHDMPTDPKWRVIARKGGQPLPCVIAVFTLMLTNASGNASERGVLLGWDHEDAGAALDMDASDVEAIYDAMQGKVLDGQRLTGWERRQPKREDTGVAARVARHRETKRNAAERDVTHGNAPDKSREDSDIPLANANDTASPADIEKTMFDSGKAFLASHGVAANKTGALLGKWKRDHGVAAVIEALGAAQREGAIDPVSFIEGRWRHARRAEVSEYGPC